MRYFTQEDLFGDQFYVDYVYAAFGLAIKPEGIAARVMNLFKAINAAF